jgi:hypothetical protein
MEEPQIAAAPTSLRSDRPGTGASGVAASARSIHPAHRSLLLLNIAGGLAVLGSYAWGVFANPETRGSVWGGVPDALRPLYTTSMLLAALGYFAYGFFVFFRLDPARTRVAGGFGFAAFHLLYAAVLVPSALWMPLTFAMLAAPSPALWLAIRAVLALVGLGSLGLVVAVATAGPVRAPLARAVAVLGALAFAFQTAILDALVWPAYFPR